MASVSLPKSPPTTTRPVRRRRRTVVWVVSLVVVLIVLIPIGIGVGTQPISPSTTWNALFAFDPTDTAHLLVRERRLPRTLLGLLVGAALGVSGAIMQALTRNPLAEPGLLGVNAGATAGVAIGVGFLGMTSVTASLAFGFVGAAAAGALVYVLGGVHRGAGPVRLVLAGAALGVVLLAVTRIVIVNGDEQVFDRFRTWMVGSLQGSGNEWLVPATIAIGAGCLLAMLLARALDASALGHDLSRSLGANPVRSVSLAAIAVVILCGTATAIAGPITFIGLTAPHLARQLVGLDHRRLLPCSALIAAIVVVFADVLGRVVAQPGEVGVGIMIAAIGAPVFVAIVRRQKIAQL